MDCERHRAALEQAALGEPETADLEAHLQQCGACREQLEQARRLLAAVDRLVETALEAEPSPDWTARVRRRLAQPPPRRFVLRPAWAAAALAAALLVGLAVPAFRKAPPAPRAARQPPLPEAAPRATPPEPARGEPAIAPLTPPRPAPAREAPAVLVPPGQPGALLRLADALGTRRVDGSSVVPTAVESGAEIPEPPALSVTPLDPEPLNPVLGPGSAPGS